MEFAVRLRWLARALVDAQTLDPSPEELTAFAKDAGAEGPLAIAPLFDGINPFRRGVLLSWKDGEWTAAVASDSFDLIQLGKPPVGANLSDFPAFASLATRTLSAAVDRFGRVPHRMVLIREALLGEMPASKLDDISRQLFRFPPGFAGNLPIEWDWRCIRRESLQVADRTEPANMSVSLKRLQGKFNDSGQAFDRIRIEFDVNTSPEAQRGRFDRAGIADFFRSALDKQVALESEFGTYLGLP